MPGFQYELGRQWASRSLSQYHEPRWAGWLVTAMCFSKVARSVTGRSKVTITGMPTPTVSPSSGAIAAKVCSSRVRSTVWKLRVRSTRLPSARWAVDVMT